MSASTRPIALAGAGIGGLTAAHALRQRGLEVELLERAPALRAQGSGITMQINAMRVFEALGLASAVRERGRELARAEVRSLERGTLAAMDLSTLATQFGVPGVAIHRARLAEALAEDLGDVLRFDTAVEGFEALGGNDGVEVRFADGTSARYAALIGCDGLHSAVRHALLAGAPDPLRYAGYTTWRGIAPVGAAANHVTIETFGGRQRFGQVPIAAGETYWFAVEQCPAGGHDGADVRAELLERFADWPREVVALLEATPREAILRTDVHDRAPRTQWGRGPVTLLGDAAHPMTPNLGQGGGQAVEDALALALELGRHGSVNDGLRAYEARRIRRANDVVVRSWRMGQLAHLHNPLARWLRDSGMRLAPQRTTERSIAALYQPAAELADAWRASTAPKPAARASA